MAFIAGSLGRGGAERQLYGWCQALRDRSWDIAVVTTDVDGYYIRPLERCGVEVLRLDRGSSSVSRVVRVAGAARAWDPSVVVSVQAHVNPHAIVAARLSRVRSIGALRTSPDRAGGGLGRLGRPALWAPDMLVGNCSLHLAAAVADYGAKPSRVAHLRNWVDLDTPMRRKSLVDFNAVFVGRLVDVKRPFDALSAITEVRRMGLRCGLVMVGDGPLRPALDAAARGAGAADRVEFVGHVDDVRPYLADASVLIQTSESEGSSNVILEAMAQQVPVVATRVGDSCSLLSDGRGLLVDVGRPDEVAEGVASLANDPTGAAMTAKRARRHVETYHSLDSVGGRLDRLLRAALVEGRD